MKKLLLIFCLALLCADTQAQISITSADMPVAPDTALRTRSTLILTINYSSTGPNHTWTYNNLRNAEQPIDTFLTVGSTNPIYALIFADFSFNPNRANVAQRGQALPTNPLFTSGESFDFFHRSSTEYRQVGIGSVVNGLPLPITYSDKDEVYSFPLNYGDVDSSTAAFNFGIPGLLSYYYTHTRINEVDGWGTLNIGSNSYNVLRVKSTIFAKDSIRLDSLGFNIVTPRATAHEYKWLANGIEVPVLQINTSVIFGFEIVNEIIFRDDPLNVEPQLTQNSYCAGSTIQIPYVKSGTFNGGINANDFTAQLSDSSGSFANPVDIGTVASTQSGVITAIIPSNTIPGFNYRIRIVASNPSFEGDDNGFPLAIINDPAPLANLYASDTVFCEGSSIILSSDTGSLYFYQWYNNGMALNGETNSILQVSSAGYYQVMVSNACDGTLSDSVYISMLSAPSVSLSSFSDDCANTAIFTLSGGLPLGGVYSGNTVSGTNFFPSQAGAGSHTIYYTYTDSVGCSSSDSSSILIHPQPNVTLASLDTICTTHAAFQLNNGMPSGGTYIGAGIVNNVFDPSTVLPGVSVITYSYTDSNGCSSAANGPVVVDLCTGINEIESQNISIYPIPASSKLFIESNHFIYGMELFDAQGKLINRINFALTMQFDLSIENLDSGLYLLQLKGEAGIIQTRFVKQ
ncbi:MAG TPA: T9SS type A sorting domain-containing protein [Bacteroidia bacterium]|nr:T9SS type A sorting domain-containing protein [Bacteroidia bacterium]